MNAQMNSTGRVRGPFRASHLKFTMSLFIAFAIATTLGLGGPTSSTIASAAAGSTVTVGTGSHFLDGTNVARQTNQLILYTRTANQTKTPTNKWGAEAVVIKGKVVSINDRQVTGAAATAIPSGSVVLSGHGLSREWLVANAKVGATVTLPGGATGTPTTPVTPTATGTPSTTATAPPPSGGGGLPADVMGVWHNSWSNFALRSYPSNVTAIVNNISLAMAVTGGSGTGKLSYDAGEPSATLKSDISEFKSRGTNVLMGIGGSNDGGISITTNAQADQTFVSIQGFISTYGINGIDFDLESGSTWNTTSVAYLFGKLKATYGSKFIIGITPGLYDPYTAKWMDLVSKAGASNYDYMAVQLYDFVEAQSSALTAVAVSKCDLMSRGNVPQSKMILGFSLGNGNTPSTSLVIDAYNAAKAKYPAIRGAMVWEDVISAGRGWDFFAALGPVVNR